MGKENGLPMQNPQMGLQSEEEQKDPMILKMAQQEAKKAMAIRQQ